jgi:transcription initiation factor TFIIIB Brf1 subunit/transcription initiation factor TFIIB
MENPECPQCGNSLANGAAVCGSCGKEVKDDEITLPAKQKDKDRNPGTQKVYAVLVVFLVFLGGITILIFTGLLPNPMKIFSTAAIVNGEKISIAELDQKIDIYKKMSGQNSQLASATPEGKAAMANTRMQLLNKMIQEKILVTEAAREKITVTPQEIAERITIIKQSMKFSDKDFDAFLKNHAMTPSSFEKRIEKDILIAKLIVRGTQDNGLTTEAFIDELNKKAKVEVFDK